VIATRLAEGLYRVEHDGRAHIVYVAGVAGSGADVWAFWNGEIFRGSAPERAAPSRMRRIDAPQSLTAPMPATVINVLVEPGAIVKKGDTVVLLEAMKMELPVRAPADGMVKSVRCRAGELVQPDAVLIELM
jgi:3-methylcrotonyl-CoA carboxylase alpha subunit